MMTEPAFDALRPPDPALVADCVHCGFCLPTCPTYRLWGEEMDSPRGRIHLIKAGLEGGPLTPALTGHIDACLGCLACVTACPSGVRFDRLLDATRAQLERRAPRTRADKALRAAIFALFPHRGRLAAAALPLRALQRVRLDAALTAALGRVAPRLAAMLALAPRLRATRPLPPVVEPVGAHRATVGLLTGCVQHVMFPQVNAATARVLATAGCRVVIPAGQGCCGALSSHAGRDDEARRFARATIDTFTATGVDAVIINSAGCGSAMKDYVHLLADDPDYRGRAAHLSAACQDLSEFLVGLGPVTPRHRLPLRVGYHDACHLSHGQGIRDQPRTLLRAIPGVTLVPLPDADICCGSAGIYNILHPQAARQLGDDKAAAVAAGSVDVVVTSNPGCLMQLRTALARAGTPTGATPRVEHLATVLDAAHRGVGW